MDSILLSVVGSLIAVFVGYRLGRFRSRVADARQLRTREYFNRVTFSLNYVREDGPLRRLAIRTLRESDLQETFKNARVCELLINSARSMKEGDWIVPIELEALDFVRSAILNEVAEAVSFGHVREMCGEKVRVTKLLCVLTNEAVGPVAQRKFRVLVFPEALLAKNTIGQLTVEVEHHNDRLRTLRKFARLSDRGKLPICSVEIAT